MRIVSLAPSATELLFALGLEDDVVGVTHACNHPPEARELPRVTRARAVDARGTIAAGEAARGGASAYEIDVEGLHRLAPDLLITQTLHRVVASSPDEIRALAEEIDSQPMVITLEPHTLGEVLDGVRTIAQATDTKDAAVDLIREASARIDRIRLAVRGARRPRVVALDALDPPRAAGHWVPQLIDYAGGEDVLGFAGEPPDEFSWNAVQASAPEILIVMPSGFDAEFAHREAEMHAAQLASVGANRVIAVDAAAQFSRPGPRLIEGLELLAQLLHPELVAENPEYAGRALPVEL